MEKGLGFLEPLPNYLTLHDFASHVGRSKSNIMNWIIEGKIMAYRHSGVVAIPLEELSKGMEIARKTEKYKEGRIKKINHD